MVGFFSVQRKILQRKLLFFELAVLDASYEHIMCGQACNKNDILLWCLIKTMQWQCFDQSNGKIL